MIQNLSVQNYRTFKELNVSNLAQVNLIVGKNNSGKTSLLEAIYLLINNDYPANLIDILQTRGEIHEETLTTSKNLYPIATYRIDRVFYNYQFRPNLVFTISSDNKYAAKLRVQLTLWNEQDDQISRPAAFQNGIEEEIADAISPIYKLTFIRDNKYTVVPIYEDGQIRARLTTSRKLPKVCKFITPNNCNYDQLSSMWNNIALTSKEDRVVEALKILDPAIERIGFTSHPAASNGILLKLRNQSNPIPLSSMGDGIRRLLFLIVSAVSVENGVLLADEIDTGLYYRSQIDMWHLLLKVSRTLGIQVFATTHSLDCVMAFENALSGTDRALGQLLRLESKEGRNHIIPYTSEELSIAVHQDIEVR